MFRRKTDQVYSTLQQVQRRMTKQTEAGSQSASHHSQSASRPARPVRSQVSASMKGSAGAQPDRMMVQTTDNFSPAVESPFTTPQVRYGSDAGLADNEPSTLAIPARSSHAPHTHSVTQTYAPEEHYYADSDGAQAPASEHAIQLKFPVLCVLSFLWIASITVAYNIGSGHTPVADDGSQHLRLVRAEGVAGTGVVIDNAEHTGSNTGAQVTRPAQQATVRVVQATDRDILVLQSVRRATPAARRDYTKKANSYNKTARKYPDKLKPYFGVRNTTNNGLQLYYGLKDSVVGVKKSEHVSIEAIMKSKQVNNKRGYPNAYWVTLRR